MTAPNATTAPNRNSLWAQIFVDELARSGLRAVCIAPGSRSTPLTLAFAEHPAVRVYSHLDERSAAFFALGLGMASGEPAAVLCTSGTAAANFYPAVIEAYMSQVPLLVLTADRSHELRDSGANQTIDQIRMYGDHVLWSVDVALPEADAPAVALRNLRTLACRVLATAGGLRKGPVHVNFPFRKPLEPTPVPSDNTQIALDAQARSDGAAYTRFSHGTMTLSQAQNKELAAAVLGCEAGLIVCGPGCPGGDFPQAVAALSAASGYPVLADPLSGVRYGNPESIGGYDTFLMEGIASLEPPRLVLRFGALPTSKWLNEYLDGTAPEYRIHVRANGVWADDAHRTTHFIQADEAALCRALADQLAGRAARESGGLHGIINAVERATWQAVADEITRGGYFDGAVLFDVVDLLPADSSLFVGNSLPVRHLDQFGRPAGKKLRVCGSRGASGIDGIISTALGVGAARPGCPLVLVIGDISFYHDMNGLLAVQRCGVPVTVVLLNNDGGGIFHRLPIRDYEPAFTELFITPHGLDFAPAAQLYGLKYVRADDRMTFRSAFESSVAGDASCLIEVRTDAHHDLRRRRDVIEAVKSCLQPERLPGG